MREPPASLQERVQQRFTPEDKTERVSRALPALKQYEPMELSPEQWRWVAENVDLDEQAQPWRLIPFRVSPTEALFLSTRTCSSMRSLPSLLNADNFSNGACEKR
jgi:hypothetical protein